MDNIVFNEDCMAVMARYPDKYFDLAVVDPPYGIGEDGRKTASRAVASAKWKNPRPKNYKNGGWDNSIPEDLYFDELVRVSKNQIIWGANHFGYMRPSSGWIVWHKKSPNDGSDFSDCELAYTSFKKGVRLFHFPWIGFGAINAKENRIHPTQKPVALYDWIFKNYLKQIEICQHKHTEDYNHLCDICKNRPKILDTHLGSGSSRIAAHKAKLDFVGCELDKDYFDAQNKRYNLFKQQQTLF